MSSRLVLTHHRRSRKKSSPEFGHAMREGLLLEDNQLIRLLALCNPASTFPALPRPSERKRSDPFGARRQALVKLSL
jgi:hypothetical protein